MKLGELGERARQRALTYWCEKRGEWWDSSDWEGVYEDAKSCFALLGVEIDYDGRNNRLDVEWSGFYCQGSGLTFAGAWRADQLNLAKLHAEIGEEGGDKELRAIGAELMGWALRFPSCRVKFKHPRECMQISWMHLADDDLAEEDELYAELDAGILPLMERLADWWYQQLEDAYEYHVSEAATIEWIELAKEEFDEDGHPA